MKKIALIFIGLILTLEGYATVDWGWPYDRLLVNGEEKAIYEAPLEHYLQLKCDFERVFEFDRDFLNPHNHDHIRRLWEVRDGKLYLIEITAKDTNDSYPLNKLFPDTEGPVLASWYSGVIEYSYGNVLVDGETAILDNRMIIHVAAGVVKNQSSINYRERTLKYGKIYMKNVYPFASKNTFNPEWSGMTRSLHNFRNDDPIYVASSYGLGFFVQIVVEADIDDFGFKEEYRKLSLIDFLELVASETHTQAEMSLNNDGDIVYTIKDANQLIDPTVKTPVLKATSISQAGQD